MTTLHVSFMTIGGQGKILLEKYRKVEKRLKNQLCDLES